MYCIKDCSAWKKKKTEPLKIWNGYKRITEN